MHPFWLLWLPDAEAKTREYQRFADDLTIAAALLKSLRSQPDASPVLHRTFPEFHVPVIWIEHSPAHCILGRYP